MKYSTISILKKTYTISRPYWPYITLLFLIGLIAIPITLLQPYALKLLIDCGFGNESLPGIIRIFFSPGYQFSVMTVAAIAATLIILITLLEYVHSYINWVLGTWVGEKLVLNFRTRVFNHMQRLSLIYHDTKGTSDSLYRIQWDTMAIRSLLLTEAPALITSLLMLVAMIIVLFFINVNFALIALCTIPPLIFLTVRSTKVLRRDWYKVKEAESDALSIVNEALSSLRIVKSFGQEINESNRFTKSADEAVKGHVKMARIGASYSFLVGMVLALGMALFIWLGASYVKKGNITIGELTLSLAYLTQVFTPLQNIIKQLNEVQSSFTGIERVLHVLDLEKEVKENEHAIPISQTHGEFEFKNVSFSYSRNQEILRTISFSTLPGDRVGIMGSTGAGKSTLINLLNRFYDPSNGIILLDKRDIRDYKLAEYRALFSIVLQDSVLFSSTIAENIRYGRPGASDKEVMEAAKSARAHDFIINSKDGYETIVGERGMQLSGGERQRISLARAFIKNAPILILDEPTSSLDIRTENDIMQSIEELMKGRTTFMITHRLDTLKKCNLLLHLENGQLIKATREFDEAYIEQTKDTLLAKNGNSLNGKS